MHDAKDTPKGEGAASQLDSFQDSGLVEAVRQTLAVQPKSGEADSEEQQPNQSLQHPGPVSEFQELSLEICACLLDDIDADNAPRISVKPSRHRGTRDSEACNDAWISGLTDQLSESRIVGSQLATRRFHAGDYRQECHSGKEVGYQCVGRLASGVEAQAVADDNSNRWLQNAGVCSRVEDGRCR